MRTSVRSRLSLLVGSVCFVVASSACGGGSDGSFEVTTPEESGSESVPAGQQAVVATGDAPSFDGTWTIIAYVTDEGFSGGAIDPVATFELADDRIVGSTGCRDIEFPVERSGEYGESGALDRNLRGQSIVVSTTDLDGGTGSCDEEGAAQDAQLVLAFERAQRWAIDGDTFFLLGDTGNEIVAQRAP